MKCVVEEAREVQEKKLSVEIDFDLFLGPFPFVLFDWDLVNSLANSLDLDGLFWLVLLFGY